MNLVNASALGEERGIELTELIDASSGDFTELITVRVGSGADAVEVSGTGVGPRNDPYLVGVWGQSFYLPLAEHLAVFRYSDQPGMIGQVGTCFGEEGVNIISAAVGAESEDGQAVMVLTTDAPVEQSTIDRILETSGLRDRPRHRPVGVRRPNVGSDPGTRVGWPHARGRHHEERRPRRPRGPGAA